jgi:hypothetical protein
VPALRGEAGLLRRNTLPMLMSRLLTPGAANAVRDVGSTALSNWGSARFLTVGSRDASGFRRPATSARAGRSQLVWGSSTSSRTLAGHPADLPHLDRKEHPTTCHHSGPRTARQIRLFWWIAGPTDELPRLGLPTGTYSAFGFGGNFLTVLPHARRCGVRAERHWRGTVQQRLQRVLGPSRAGTGLRTSRVVGSGASGTAD